MISLFAIAANSFVACSDDEKSAATPNVEIVSIEPYNAKDFDTQECIIRSVEFESSRDWRLYADKIWVLFSKTKDGVYAPEIKGAAGTHKVYMKLTNDARTFEPSAANWAFESCGKEFPMGPEYRHAKAYDTEIKDDNGEVVDAIVIAGSNSGTSATGTFEPGGNFSYGIKEYPVWVEEPAYSEGKYTLSVIDEYIATPQEGEITFSAINGYEAEDFTVPVSYPGMLPEAILIDGDKDSWKISDDGTTFSRTNDTTGDTESTSVSYGIRCLNYEYREYFVGENVADAAWLSIERDATDASNISVVASPLPTDVTWRKGCLFAFPESVYDSYVAACEIYNDYDSITSNYWRYAIMEAEQGTPAEMLGFAIAAYESSPIIIDGVSYDIVAGEVIVGGSVYAIIDNSYIIYENVVYPVVNRKVTINGKTYNASRTSDGSLLFTIDNVKYPATLGKCITIGENYYFAADAKVLVDGIYYPVMNNSALVNGAAYDVVDGTIAIDGTYYAVVVPGLGEEEDCAKDASDNDFLVGLSSELLEIKEVDGEIYPSEYIYAATFEYGKQYAINTMCTATEYPTADDVKASFKYRQGSNWVTPTVLSLTAANWSLNEQGYWVCSIYMPTKDVFATYETEYVVLCMSEKSNNTNTKLLVLRPNE